MEPFFGAKLRALRLLYGLSQSDLVTHLISLDSSSTLTQSTISNLERGHDVPSLELALRLAHLFSIPVSALLYDNELVQTQRSAFLPQQLGTKLRSLRKSRKLTQAAVGQALGESRTYISNLENGSRYPTLALLIRLAAFYDVSIDTLVDDTISLPASPQS